jgi:hypothetical protein
VPVNGGAATIPGKRRKALVALDVSKLMPKPMSLRSPGGDRPMLRVCVEASGAAKFKVLAAREGSIGRRRTKRIGLRRCTRSRGKDEAAYRHSDMFEKRRRLIAAMGGVLHHRADRARQGRFVAKAMIGLTSGG